jgi:hypothetical protein
MMQNFARTPDLPTMPGPKVLCRGYGRLRPLREDGGPPRQVFESGLLLDAEAGIVA